MIFFKKQLTRQAGFTIVEAMLAIFIVTIVGISIIAFESDIFSLNNIISNIFTSQNEARQTLKTMTAEIRSLSPSSNGAFPIAEATDVSFIFYSNTDSDQLKERVRYFLDGQIFKKGVIKPTGNPLIYNQANEVITELVHNVAPGTSQIFSYYDTNYDGTIAPLAFPVSVSAVRLIKITVPIDQNAVRTPGPIILTTQVTPRNLKDNL